ncbi:MAG: FGGY-family carbohydrate kinase [Granulosicoccus sp.]
MSYVIGIDGGTESIRAFVFDLDGRLIASNAATYTTNFPAAAEAEQQPHEWWQALGEAVQGAVTSAKIKPADVLGIAFDGTCCSVVALDEYDAPLRPCLLWMDVRAHSEAREIAALDDRALMVNGAGADPVSAEWMIPKALWIKRNQPEIFAKAVRICEYQEYINLKMTGRYVGSKLTASIRWHWHAEHGFPDSLLKKAGLTELRDKWPADIIPVGAKVGDLTVTAAVHLGLAAGTPIAQGGADAMIGMIGLGVRRAGELALITGSSHLHLGLANNDVHKRGVFGSYRDAVYDGLNLVEGGQTSTGSAIAWFRREFAPDKSFDELNTAASALPAGANGVRALEHFQGNRTPWIDPQSRGALVGLSLSHSAANVYRALLEAVCLGTRVIVDSFDTPFDRIVVAGGATNSSLWMQIHADTLQMPLERTEVSDAPGLGCAMLAAVLGGAYASIDEAANAMVRTTGCIEPDTSKRQVYEDLLGEYISLYEVLKARRELAQ